MMIASRNGMVVSKPLPYDAEVDYLESTGTQYIILPNLTFDPHTFGQKIKAFLNTSQPSYPVTLAGFWGPGSWGDGTPSFGINGTYQGQYFGSSMNWRAGNGNGMAQRGNQGEIVEMSIVNLGDWDGTSMTMRITSPLVNTDVAFSNPYPQTVVSDYIVFGTFYSGGVRENPCMKLYGLTLYNLSTPFVDLIPVRFTNEQGVSEGAMYDRLGVGGMNPDGSPRTDGLYRNRGTGVFVFPTA